MRWAVIGVVGVLGVEVTTGAATGSLALLGDAIHLATDIGSLALAWWASARARQRATARRTFGYHRTGIMVAVVNGAALAAVAAGLAIAAISRLEHPVGVRGGPVVVAGSIALVANLGIARILHGAGDDLGTRSAFLHVLADALGSAAVVVGGVLVAAAGLGAADAAVSLVIAGLILVAALGVVSEAGLILAEGTPRDLDTETVRRAIVATPGVEGVHDLHIWSLDRRHRALSAHLLVADRPLGEVTRTLRELELVLCSRFGIEHVTLQPECDTCELDAGLHCELDTRHAAHQPRGGPETTADDTSAAGPRRRAGAAD